MFINNSRFQANSRSNVPKTDDSVNKQSILCKSESNKSVCFISDSNVEKDVRFEVS